MKKFLLALLAGFGMRASGRPEVARAATVAWLVAVALAAGTTAVVGSEYDANDNNIALYVGLVALAAAIPLWVIQPSHPQVVGVVGSLFMLAQGAGAWADPFNAEVAGVTALLLGAAGLALADTGRFEPGATSRFLFAALAMGGAFEAMVDDGSAWAETLFFAVAAGLVALSLFRGRFAYMIVGVLGAFVGLVWFMFEHFEDEIGAPVVLMLTGAILIATVLLLARYGNKLHRRGQPA